MSYEPMPVQQHAFEDICTYLMTHLVKTRTGSAPPYSRLGVNGQTQWGLDLFTDHPKYAPIVGQCKHRMPGKRLKKSEVFEDLRKTDAYPRPIEMYFVLTNSENDSDLQTALIGHTHKRLDGSTFQVQLINWSRLPSLSFIPKDKLQMYFPVQAHHAQHFLPPQNTEAVIAAYDLAPSVLRHWFSEEDMQEILCSPATLSITSNLWAKMNLFQQAVMAARLIRQGSRALIERRCVREIFRVLPAIETFAQILQEYKEKLASMSSSDPTNIEVMMRSESLRWDANAVEVNYRALVEGDPSWDFELASYKQEQTAI